LKINFLERLLRASLESHKISKKNVKAQFLKTPLLPYKEKEIEKKYYTIGEVADSLGVATSLIRFWEGEFDIIKPKKNRKGNRQFTKEDLNNVKLIYHLVKEKGFTLQGARDFIKSDVNVAGEKIEVIETLKNIKSFLVDIRDRLSNE
jgi:DNA-binding transcriptional MerR regulator